MAITATAVTPHMPSNFRSALVDNRYVIGVGAGTFAVFDSNTDTIRAYNWTAPGGFGTLNASGSPVREYQGAAVAVFPNTALDKGCIVFCYPDGTFDSFLLPSYFGTQIPDGFDIVTGVPGVVFAVGMFDGRTSGVTVVECWSAALVKAGRVVTTSDYDIRGLICRSGVAYHGGTVVRRVDLATMTMLSSLPSSAGFTARKPILLGSDIWWSGGNQLRQIANDNTITSYGGTNVSDDICRGSDGRFYWGTGSTLGSVLPGEPSRNDTLPMSASRWEPHAVGSELRIAYR